MPVSTRPDVDLLSPSFYVDLDAMHDAFAWMRANEPVFRDEANGLWAVTRHADLVDVERRSDVFSSAQGYRSYDAPGEDNMIALDDPRHQAQRRLINRRFTPRAVRDLDGLISRLIGELIDDVAPRGRMEVVGDLAAALPAKLTAHLLGFPEERWADIRSWSERLMRYDQVNADDQAGTDFMMAIMEFNQLLEPLAEARRAEPGDDLVSTWATSELDGCPMAHDTMINETGLVISGGAETTRTVIARSLATFAAHPDQWEAMAEDPSLVPGAVEEMIRWVTPLNNFFRTATVDDRIGDQPVAAGDRVMLAYPSANRDEAVFEDPYAFDIGRSPNNHVAFGQGTHFCLGASLARFELTLLFTELTRRLTDLEVLSGPGLEANIFVGAVTNLEMGFSTRT